MGEGNTMSNQKPKFWDEYEIKARYIPCFLSVIPLVHFLVMLLGQSFWEEVITEISWIVVITDISFSLILMLSLIQLQTAIGKYIIEKSVFGRNGEYFPTNDILLLSGRLYSKEKKMELRKKIEIHLNSKFSEDELENLENSRLFIREITGQIRRVVGKGIMTYQYNIRYGFLRNIIGGFAWSLTGSLGCIIMYILNKEWGAMSFFITLFIIWILLLIFKRNVLMGAAESYADNLFLDFLSINESKTGGK